MNNLLGLLFLLGVAAVSVNALKCYSCQGSGCDSDTRLWETVTCGAAVPQFTGYQWACLKQDYKDRVTYKPMVQRKCVSVEMRNGKPFYQCRTDLGEAENCPVCLDDLCNSSSKIGFIGIGGLILSYLLTKIVL